VRVKLKADTRRVFSFLSGVVSAYISVDVGGLVYEWVGGGVPGAVMVYTVAAVCLFLGYVVSVAVLRNWSEEGDRK